ncbi:MAG TPA: carboxypeptidase-like regulatory domain-containing protein, partial [Gammaproteobacteria bacterium]
MKTNTSPSTKGDFMKTWNYVTFLRGFGKTTAIIALLATQAAWADKPARINWSEERIMLEAPAGIATTRVLRFIANADIAQVNLEPVPALADLVTVEPAVIQEVQAGVSYSVLLRVTPDEETAGRHFGGTIHVREGARTLPATFKLGIDVSEFQGPTETEDERPSPGVLTFNGVSETGFNHVSDSIRLQLSDAIFSHDPQDLQMYRAGWPVPDSSVQISDNEVVVSSPLQTGRNDFTFYALDNEGRTLIKTFTLWAGDRTLLGRVVAENGAPVPGAVVRVELGDDKRVSTLATADNSGNFTLTNLPPRTLFLESTPDDQRAGSVAANGADGFVQLVVYGFKESSGIDNNNFSQGLAGWDIGSAPVVLIAHEEEPPAPAASAFDFDATDNGRAERHLALRGYSANSAMAMDSENIDLVLATAGEGAQHISRTFTVKPGTSNVTVRYRFITTEVLGGYFGTRFNDYFNVSIRSQQGGGIVSFPVNWNTSKEKFFVFHPVLRSRLAVTDRVRHAVAARCNRSATSAS